MSVYRTLSSNPYNEHKSILRNNSIKTEPLSLLFPLCFCAGNYKLLGREEYQVDELRIPTDTLAQLYCKIDWKIYIRTYFCVLYQQCE